MHPASDRCMMLILLKCFVSSEKHLINIRSSPFISSNSTHSMRSQWVMHLALSRVRFTSKANVNSTQVVWVAFISAIQACKLVNNIHPKNITNFASKMPFAMHFTFANLNERKCVPLVY